MAAKAQRARSERHVEQKEGIEKGEKCHALSRWRGFQRRRRGGMWKSARQQNCHGSVRQCRRRLLQHRVSLGRRACMPRRHEIIDEHDRNGTLGGTARSFERWLDGRLVALR